jgi:DNA-binding response OmpR family regulator
MVVALVSMVADVESLRRLLSQAGWRSSPRAINEDLPEGSTGVDRLAEADTDPAAQSRLVILLSMNSPGSMRMLARVTARYSRRGIPVIVVTPPIQHSSTRDLIVRAMAAGAEDFMAAASAATELSLRLDALAWRAKRPRKRRAHSVYDIEVDRLGRRLCHGGHQVLLTPSEFRVFSCLATVPGRPVSRVSIQQRLAGRSRSRTANMVDVYVLYLRRKLLELQCSSAIRTVRGVGYALVPASAASLPRRRPDQCDSLAAR